MMYVGPPNEDARTEIFRNHCKKIPIANDIDIPLLVQRTEGYSGAEIVAVCREASIATLDENILANFVEMKHFLIAIQKVTPRITSDMISFYDNFRKTIKVQSI